MYKTRSKQYGLSSYDALLMGVLEKKYYPSVMINTLQLLEA
jgi:hypothetical protein